MSDRCYMEVTFCLGDKAYLLGECELTDAPYRESEEAVPGSMGDVAQATGKPFEGYHSASMSYGPYVFVSDGQEQGRFCECPTLFDKETGPTVLIHENGQPDLEGLEGALRYYRLVRWFRAYCRQMKAAADGS